MARSDSPLVRMILSVLVELDAKVRYKIQNLAVDKISYPKCSKGFRFSIAPGLYASLFSWI